jgi:hypothetical protein
VTSPNGNASVTTSADIAGNEGRGLSFTTRSACTAGGNCATTVGVAVTADGQSYAYSFGSAAAGDQGKASAKTTVTGGGDGCGTAGVVYSSNRNPDGSFTRELSYNSGNGCATSEVEVEDD